MSALRLTVFATLADAGPRLGIETDRGIVDATTASRAAGARALRDVISRFTELRPQLEQLARHEAPYPPQAVRRLAPLARPAKVLASLRARTGGAASPLELHVYPKASSSVIGDAGQIVLPDLDDAGLFTHNACLAVVIGRRVRALAASDWREAVFGYAAMIDVTARMAGGARWKDGRSCLGGSCDTFAPLGPWIVPRAHVDESAGLTVRLTADGELRQHYVLEDLDREIGEVVALSSRVMTLHPGDVIAIQGPADGQGPLQHGDRVVVDIDQVGRLTAAVSDPLGRRWPRDLRLDASSDDTDVRALVR